MNNKIKTDLFALIASNQIIQVYFEILDNLTINETSLTKISNSIHLFLNHLDIALKYNEFIDQNLAKDLLLKSQILFEICKENLNNSRTPYILAAIKYFLHIEDGQNDFTDFEGFEDDRIVLEAVIQYFNLEKEIQKYQEKTSA